MTKKKKETNSLNDRKEKGKLFIMRHKSVREEKEPLNSGVRIRVNYLIIFLAIRYRREYPFEI